MCVSELTENEQAAIRLERQAKTEYEAPACKKRVYRLRIHNMNLHKHVAAANSPPTLAAQTRSAEHLVITVAKTTTQGLQSLKKKKCKRAVRSKGPYLINQCVPCKVCGAPRGSG